MGGTSEGQDICPTDDLSPAADRLAQRGWLERRVNDENGDAVFRWSERAEAAIDLASLTATVSPN